MTLIEIFLIGVGLSMDAFAVSVGKGLTMQKIDKKYLVTIALYFGGFQAMMPLFGWLLGGTFASKIEKVDHWIAFVLLAFIGIKMIADAIKENREERELMVRTDDESVHTAGDGMSDSAARTKRPQQGTDCRQDPRPDSRFRPVYINHGELFLMAVATSIDALAVGVTFSFLQVNILVSIMMIGVTTFTLSAIGVVIGNRFGMKYKLPAAVIGGLILVILGSRILITHLMGG